MSDLKLQNQNLSELALELAEIPERHLMEILWRRGDLRFLLWQQQIPIYELLQNLPPNVRDYVVLCARQYGKCVESTQEVLTPTGPIPIKDLKVGDLVYGYNGDGSITPTPVLAVHEQGVKTVCDMYTRDQHVVSATKDHRFLSRWRVGKPTDRYFYDKEAELTLGKIVSGRARKFARAFVKIPCGIVHEPHAYAIGAFLGNGCGTDAMAKRKLVISSSTHHVPEKLAAVLGVKFFDKEASNYNWRLASVARGNRQEPTRSDKIHCNHFDEWIRGKKSAEKICDWNVVNTWDRESLLQFVAGLLDTDGNVHVAQCGTLRIGFYNINKQIIDCYVNAFYKLFLVKPSVNISREVDYTAFTINNLTNVRALKELDQYMVQPHKKWQPEYDRLKAHNGNEDRIGLTCKGKREAETYDITIGNDTNLFVLANQGLITHNSTFGVAMALMDAIRHRDSCILMMGPETRQICDIVRPKMRFLTRTAPDGLIVPMKADNRFHVYHDLNRGASDYTEIILGGMNENSTSQRGKTVKRIYVEEIVDVHPDQFTESIESDMGPALAHSEDGHIIYLTSLPKIPDHPFIKETIPKAKMNNAFVSFTLDDNIALTPERRLQLIEDAGGINSVAVQREYYNVIQRDEGVVVLPDWSEDANVMLRELPGCLNMHVTIDWGGVRDKTSVAFHYLDYLDNLDVFWDELTFEPNTSTDLIVRSVNERKAEWNSVKPDITWAGDFIDAPAQLVYIDLLSQYNYRASIPKKPEFRAGCNILNNRFKTRRAVIHPRCTFLIESARSGSFNKMKTDFARTEALGHCDGIASMIYAVINRTEKDPYPVGQPTLIDRQNMSMERTIQRSQGYQKPKGYGRYK